MGFEWLIAKRYLWSKKRHPFVGVLSFVSVLGISVGVAALIVVLGVMNGFDEDLKARIIGTRAHLVIESDGIMTGADPLIQKTEQVPGVQGASAYVEAQALIQTASFSTGVLVRGVDAVREKKVSRFFDYLVQGTLPEEGAGVVVGSELAKRAHLSLGSEFSILTPNMKKPVPVSVEGIFSSGMYDTDANLIFMNLPAAQRLFGLGDGVSGISVYLKKTEQAETAKHAVRQALGFSYFVRSWMDMNRTLFSALALEKTVMFVILALIIFVACLNVAGSLTILVTDKTKDIGVLKALGASPASLVRIFALDGLILGLTGAAAGLAIGGGLCAVLKKYSFVQLPQEIYYLDRLPVKIDAGDTSIVLFVAVALGLLSALYPALLAGRLDPVKALRYE